MRDILSYKNKLWKKHIRFTTAGIHDFTLQPGKYLLLCRGAKGGSANIYSGHRNIGGTAIGVLNLSAAENFHAYVGGDGGDAPVVDRSVLTILFEQIKNNNIGFWIISKGLFNNSRIIIKKLNIVIGENTYFGIGSK